MKMRTAVVIAVIAAMSGSMVAWAGTPSGDGTASAAGTSAAQGATYTCPMHPEVVSDQPGKCPKCGMNLELKQAAVKATAAAAGSKAAAKVRGSRTKARRVAPYVCPMHPEITSDVQEKCSKCGMVLQKRKVKKGTTKK